MIGNIHHLRRSGCLTPTIFGVNGKFAIDDNAIKRYVIIGFHWYGDVCRDEGIPTYAFLCYNISIR